MKNNFALLLLLLPSLIHAQAPDIEWQNTIGGGGSDFLYCLQNTKDKGYILGGISGSNISGDKTENCIGGQDYWILKVDSAGNIQWQTTIGGTEYDYLQSIETSDGGYLCGGSSLSDASGDKTEAGFGSNDYWVLKLDSLGEIQWQKAYGGNLLDYLYTVLETKNKEYFLAGGSDSGISGNKTENTNGGSDIWILKIDSIGNIIWQNTIGGNDNDGAYSAINTSDQGYILCGMSMSDASGDKTEENIPRPDGLHTTDWWVIKVDSLGNVEWDNTIGGNGNEYAASIQQSSDGGYFVSGASTSEVSYDKTEASLGTDIWVLKLDTAANIEWQKTLGGAGEDGSVWVSGYSTFDGGYIIVGNSDSNVSGNKTSDSNGGNDYWVIKIDSSGNEMWQNSIGGNKTDDPYYILQSNDGGYCIGGYSGSDLTGDKTEHSEGSQDFWVVKLYADETCTPLTYYADNDEDGYGNNDFSILSCDTPSAYVLDNSDCNDLDATINPGSLEICNVIDDNCNAIIDEDIPYYTYYEDSDADGYGNVLSPVTNCIDTIPAGYVTDNTDCDDENNTIYEPIIYYADADGDLYGDAFSTNEFCTAIPPDGYVTNNLDCNDADNSINPTSNEICNAVDDNCNELIDEDLPVQILYADADGDTYGNSETDTATCLFEISNYVSDSTDCDDTNPNIYPGAAEIFNGTDDDCDTQIDEGVSINEATDKNLFAIYPNPNNGSFTIVAQTTHFQNQAEIKILNATGQHIYQKLLTTEKTEIQLPENLHGVFQINITLDQIVIFADRITIIQ